MARSTELFELEDGFPDWISKSDQKVMESSIDKIEANVTVSKDGSGNYTTINEAAQFAPTMSYYRYVIHVRAGGYEEAVQIDENKHNLMLIGDGMDKTIITGESQLTNGDYFIAQDLCIQNTAGPENYQAVALRVSSDRTVIHRCKIIAFQDTHYAHANRQFYKDCYISGTVDFIFGDSTTVLQGCTLAPRKPMEGQKNMLTAQGRTDPNQNTGISIQFCTIIPTDDLEPVKHLYPTFLGRPWKNLSRTVVMKSNIGDIIDPADWFECDGDLNLNTCYYGEYKN
ncbi:hypothetical protein Sjap_026339 [Stephania japonica]|uniref:Pectinesterase n=1 Tax=Stephania japonica TaxID=461633 RepID=A0AAP0EB82_9MAGN